LLQYLRSALLTLLTRRPGPDGPWTLEARYGLVVRAESGACGAAYNTGFINFGNPTSGYHDFQISKVGSLYNFYIDEVRRDYWSQTQIETCWPALVGGEWQNEMLNNMDQGGGHVANPQGFHNNQYQTSSGWHNANRTLGYHCDANSYPTSWHCNTSSTSANYFDAYDSRVP